MTHDLVYVYAVLPRPLAAELHGIDGRRVRWVLQGELAAAVSDVPEADFEEEPLNRNVRDMGWLGPRAIAHQDVNARLFEASDAIVPLAFGSVFRDDQRVAQMLQEEQQPLAQQLARVKGAAEWVVALHALSTPDADQSEAVQTARAEVAAASPGRAHLLRQRLATLERDEVRRLQSDAATHVLQALRAIARDVYEEPLPADTVERPLLRVSVLMAREHDTRLLDEIEQLRSLWAEPTYRLLLTGPWPPYRFAGLKA